MGSLLRDLIHPLRPERFFREYWTRSFFVSQGSPRAMRRLRSLIALPELRDIDALLAACPDVVEAWHRGPHRRVTPSEAQKLYRRGSTIYVRGLERNVETLKAIAAELERDLGVGAGSVSCEAFASRPGAGARAHYDPDLAFNLQLRGNKRWKLAANPLVVNPSNGHTLGEPLREPLDAEQEDPTHIPLRMPRAHTRIDARPGTVVWLPRPTIHATRVTGTDESLALVLSIRLDFWLDRLLARMKELLLARCDWRAFALPPRSAADVRSQRRQAQALLDSLAASIRLLAPEELLHADCGHYLRTPWRFSPASGPRARGGEDRRPGASRGSRRTGDRVRSWALRQERPFSGAQALTAAWPGTRVEDVAEALRQLVSAGKLTRVNRTHETR